jgi:hypothetical protein
MQDVEGESSMGKFPKSHKQIVALEKKIQTLKENSNKLKI